MLAVDVRKATKADLPAVLALYGQPDLDDGKVLDLAAAERILDKMRQYPNYGVYMATLKNEVIGTFALLIMDNLAHLGAPSGIAEDVVVDSRWRGQGVGKQMMQFAMEACRKAGCYKLMLSSSLTREPAHRFYEELGFQKHGYSFLVDL